MRSSIWRRSEVGIIGSLDTPTTEHFFVLALYLRIRVASACSVTLDRTYIASIRFSAESGVQRHRVPESDGCHWFRWMSWTCEPIGVGELAQMCPWAPQAHDYPCFRHLQGTPESVYVESKLHHPIKMCGSRGSSVQCTSHATIFFAKYKHLAMYAYI